MSSKAVWNSSSLITCITTPFSAGYGTVSVSSNLIEWAHCSKQYLFVEPMELTTIFPSAGPIYGGVFVTIYGSCIPNAYELACKFGIHAVPATWYRSNLVVCSAPPILEPEDPAGQLKANVFLTLNGEDFSLVTIEFVYFKPCTILSIQPSSAPAMLSGTNVLVEIELSNTDEQMSWLWICLFGNMASKVLQISKSSTHLVLMCTAPAHSEGLTSLSLTRNEQVF